jgi:hypothetical protein
MANDDATKVIQIHGEKFAVSTPYTAGQTIGALEAKVLNQTRAENIANNFRKDVKEALDKNDADALTKVRSEFSDYEGKYEFSMGGAPRVPVDPVEREALSIARSQITAALKAEGRKVKEVDKDTLNQAIEDYAQDEEVIKLARTRVNQLKKATTASLAKLGLSAAPAAA